MNFWFYDFSKFILWLFFRFGFGLEVRGQEHVPATGPFILASNHLSFLDPPLLGAACPRRLGFMARQTLFGHPLLGAFMRGVHVIPLERSEGDLEAIREAVCRLQAGYAVAIFPEGGRQFSGQLGRPKRGVGLLAVSAKVPIIPALVQGTFEAMPPTTNQLARAKIRVAFGPRIPYTMAPASATAPDLPSLPAHVERKRAARAHYERLAEAVAERWQQLART